MQLDFAWKNLLHYKFRTLAAIVGIVFVIMLLFVQFGMKASVIKAGTLVYDQLQCDLVLASPHYLYINKAGSFPRHRLYQAETVHGVDHVMPLYIALAIWRNPETGYRDFVQLVAFHPGDRVFRLPEIEAQLDVLQTPDTLLIDRHARAEAGPTAAGVVTEVGQRQIRIGGHFTLGSGFTALGTVISSDQNVSRILNGAPLHQVTLGLVTTAPEAPVNTVAERLRQTLPPDVQVLTRSELVGMERHYWIKMTSTGIILNTGALMALVVGVVVLYQVLATDISHRLSEYATLKALGYSNRYVSGLVLQQALIFAVLGYIPAVALAFGTYALIRQLAHIPMDMTVTRLVLVFCLAVGMRAIPALAALRKAKTADPAELF